MVVISEVEKAHLRKAKQTEELESLCRS